MKLIAATILVVISGQVFADPLKQIYPFKPYPVDEIQEKVSRVTEEVEPMMNVWDMNKPNLLEASSHQKPWGGYYWSLTQGQIANNWQNKSYIKFWKHLNWRSNLRSWNRRQENHLPYFADMSQTELNELAPSEKYDLLLGDTNFDLTHRIWNFVEKWGNEKKWGFLSSIEVPNGYRIPRANKLIALWEGVCHGWALAAGLFPEPKKTVYIDLPGGKTVPFYPEDIKALISLLFANSNLQDNVIVEGYRCNDKRPKRDKFGRFIDKMPKDRSEPVLPRCADVHPAIWHASIVNLTGIQGRSFVVEIDANAVVNNHPLSGYKFNWFNPDTGKDGDLESSIVNLSNYDDPYKDNRSRSAKKLVGVEMEISFLAWSFPKMERNDSDDIRTQKFMYDLELDDNGVIVGGQWRSNRKASSRMFKSKVKQPDFFWVAPKNYSMYFNPLELEKWDQKSLTPGVWKDASVGAHNFVYNMTREFGFDEKCLVVAERGRGVKSVPCEFKYPRPLPLINVVLDLLELSK